jgi:hypothetical protein
MRNRTLGDVLSIRGSTSTTAWIEVATSAATHTAPRGAMRGIKGFQKGAASDSAI